MVIKEIVSIRQIVIPQRSSYQTVKIVISLPIFSLHVTAVKIVGKDADHRAEQEVPSRNPEADESYLGTGVKRTL
jgi:hypothetical protein